MDEPLYDSLDDGFVLDFLEEEDFVLDFLEDSGTEEYFVLDFFVELLLSGGLDDFVVEYFIDSDSGLLL